MSGRTKPSTPSAYDALGERNREANALLKDMRAAARDLQAAVDKATALADGAVDARIGTLLTDLDDRIMERAGGMVGRNRKALEDKLLEEFQKAVDNTADHLEQFKTKAQRRLDQLADMCDQNGDVAVMLAVRLLLAHGGRYEVPGEDAAYILVRQQGGVRVTGNPRQPVASWIVVQEDVPNADEIIRYVNHWVAHQFAAKGMRPYAMTDSSRAMFNPDKGTISAVPMSEDG